MFIPDTAAVENMVDAVFGLMFPVGDDLKSEELNPADAALRIKIESVLAFVTLRKESVTLNFLEKLTTTKKKLLRDAEFILTSDPAATHIIEVVAMYPGFYAIYCYRIAHCFAKMGVKFLPRMITEYAHRKTGIDIHPLASIGCPFSIDHGTGIVIGETTKIGQRVKMYQGVTLGALSVSKSKAAKKRHPTIQSDVILYAGSTILGGETMVGRNSVIGGNVFLTESVPPFSLVYHRNEVIVRNHDKYNEPVNFVI